MGQTDSRTDYRSIAQYPIMLTVTLTALTDLSNLAPYVAFNVWWGAQ